jgi:predicted transcriptional regulator of viral defense system
MSSGHFTLAILYVSMWIKTYASQILRDLAESRRRVVSDWRIHILACRIAHAENAPLPDAKRATAIRQELLQRGDIVAVEGVGGVYLVNAAYANLLEVSEEQIVQEANPWAVFGFLTAMAYHGLSDLTPKEVYAIAMKDGDRSKHIPLGTMPEDWTDLKAPNAKMPKRVRQVPVHWTQVSGESGFGVMVGYSLGVPIYVTDVERTLIDSLRMPDKSGGIAKVLQAWRSATDMDVGRLISYTESCGNKILRQRVGFLLEKLGRVHPRLDEWRRGLQRGGSVKLVASDPYADTYSAEWNLSLNVPPSVLAILKEG